MFDLAESKQRNLSVAAAPHQQRLRHIAMVGNFPPRRCGIATFSADLYAALQRADSALRCDIVAMNDDDAYEYPKTVSLEISQNEPRDYARAADQLSRSNIELVCIQHEFGIFG